MAWNYRVIKSETPDGTPIFDVQEVHYREDGSPHSWSVDQRVLCHENFDDLVDALEKIQEAVSKPVLEISADRKSLRELK